MTDLQMTDPATTLFAPAQRQSKGEVSRQSRDILDLALLRQAFDAVNDLILVLNAQRQIVYANRNVLELLGAEALEVILGQRPGEALGCKCAAQAPGGCGTSQNCSTCGAVAAILTAQGGKPDCRECRILQKSGDAMDLQVRTSPLRIEGRMYTICAITDISHQKRRRVLERIFFHDVLNTAGGVLMLASRLARGVEGPTDRQRLNDLLTGMVDEIVAQRDLMAAETAELAVRVEPFAVREFLEGLVQLYFNSPVCQKRWLTLEDCCDLELRSDRKLMARVVGNLIKNALEAAPLDSVVDVSAIPRDGGVEFSIHNEGTIPLEVQLQMFQRSFSTKGAGRGLGTYSVKLLTERYLAGRVSLVSNPDDGTIFRVWYPQALAQR